MMTLKKLQGYDTYHTRIGLLFFRIVYNATDVSVRHSARQLIAQFHGNALARNAVVLEVSFSIKLLNAEYDY